MISPIGTANNKEPTIGLEIGSYFFGPKYKPPTSAFKRVVLTLGRLHPVYPPDRQTFSVSAGMYQRCQRRKFPLIFWDWNASSTRNRFNFLVDLFGCKLCNDLSARTGQSILTNADFGNK